MARSLINMPEGQIIGSGSESESRDKNIKEERKQQKEQEKKIAKV